MKSSMFGLGLSANERFHSRVTSATSCSKFSEKLPEVAGIQF